MNIAVKHYLPLFLLLISSCSGCGGDNPEQIARQWCELNEKINTTTDPIEHQELIEQIRDLEMETKIRFGEDKEAMEKIYQQTQDCDQNELD